MLTIIYSNQFKKDYKKIQNNVKDKQALIETLNILCEKGYLPPKYKEHPSGASGSAAATGSTSNVGTRSSRTATSRRRMMPSCSRPAAQAMLWRT